MVDHVIDVIMVGITLVLSQAVSVFASAKCRSVSKHIMLYIWICKNSSSQSRYRPGVAQRVPGS
jgi:hypothetical protein